jgi:hypothetical protein
MDRVDSKSSAKCNQEAARSEVFRQSEKNHQKFRKELKGLLNRYSIENESNTPDFILADYLYDCLRAFERAANTRSRWSRSATSGTGGVRRGRREGRGGYINVVKG